MRYAISACLLGENCKYNGGNNAHRELIAFMQDKEYITICPEVFAGLPIPRACCEIIAGKVINTKGEDWTIQFQQGAQEAIDKLQAFQVDLVILQPRSPSCGKGKIYDGSFQGRLKKGDGVFAQMLEAHGIKAKCVDEFITSLPKKE